MERYIAHYWGIKKIERIQIEKETDKSYWIKGRKRKKYTNSEKIFVTYAEAKDFIINEQLKKIESAKSQLSYLENELEKIKQL